MLILGYPQDSYMKLPGNYYSLRSIKTLPFFVMGILAVDFAVLFLVYYLSKRNILRSAGPIITSIETLANGRPASLSMRGELSGIAESVNRASDLIRKQNKARANWISGVSHDIRTPLSMILGYAERISHEKKADPQIRREAEIIRKQSIKIREFVQDLNLVSQLEYEMQPLHKAPVSLSGLIRSYAAELLNTGLPDVYSINIAILPGAETIFFDCDARLITRAIGNLVQNSICHNPGGCDITLALDCTVKNISLSVSDNGAGLSAGKWKELNEKPHYMESTDDRLDLRHGLGLMLVRQITNAHQGTMRIESKEQQGCKVILDFPAMPSYSRQSTFLPSN